MTAPPDPAPRPAPELELEPRAEVRAELAALASAARAAAGRAARRGVRRVAAAAAAAGSPSAAKAPAAAAGRAPAAAAPRAPETAGEALEDPAAEVRRRAQAAPDLAALAREVAACTACDLCRTRTRTVFADGSGRAGVLFVGEAPGADEDRQGVPFVGRAGRLLSDIITKGMGLAREDVYIANVLKCRPPDNRDPTTEEKRRCTGWLDRQIELVAPRVIVPLGRHAAGHLLSSDAPMGRLRGRVHTLGGRQVVPTYHPAYLLRSPHMKKDCWADIQLAMRALGLPLPGPGGGSAPRADGGAPPGGGDSA